MVTSAWLTMSVNMALTGRRVRVHEEPRKHQRRHQVGDHRRRRAKDGDGGSLARLIVVGLTGSGSRIAASRTSTTSESHCATASSALTIIDSEM